MPMDSLLASFLFRNAKRNRSCSPESTLLFQFEELGSLTGVSKFYGFVCENSEKKTACQAMVTI